MGDAKQPPQSVLARSRELFALAAKLGHKELTKKMREALGPDNPVARLKSQVDQAQALVESLGRLKGAAMKVGQLLSIEAKDFLPPEVLDVLAQLQDSAPGMSEARIRELIAAELGADKLARLEGLTPQPIAAASIGQVHAADWEGRRVALKIQYPGIAESIESDLTVLRNVVAGLLRFSKKTVPLDDLFAELRCVLTREVDYLEEATQTRAFGELFARHPGYRVPEVVDGLCSKRVLGLSFEEGMRLQAFLKTEPSQELRDHYGKLVLDLYVIEFFEARRVQTDPNFANFLFRPQERSLVLLDFGATRAYTPEFVADYKRLLRLIREGTRDELIEHACGKMQLLSTEESAECLDGFVEMLRISVEPFDPARQPFDFADLDYSSEVREKTLAFTRKVQRSAPPHQLIFLHRKLGGIFTLLKTMNSRLDLVPYWERLVAEPAR